MQLLIISIFTTLIGAMIFELGVKTVLLAVLINAFKAILGVMTLVALYLGIRRVRG